MADNQKTPAKSNAVVPQIWEKVTLEGHIIDSLLLPKVLDLILAMGGSFEFEEVEIGKKQQDDSHVVIKVGAADARLLSEILQQIAQHGARLSDQTDCELEAVDKGGVLPERFYATTNLGTEIRVDGEWIPVTRQEMDCGIRYDRASKSAVCIPMADVEVGNLIVVGHQGVRIQPEQRPRDGNPDVFQFMNSTVSSEKPKHVTVKEIAQAMREASQGTGKVLVVAGPAVVHTGSREHLSYLIREGFVDVLFAGNALATHDIEQSFFNTSLGISMEHGGSIEEGHEHHLRTINRIRRAGSIQAAVESGLLTDGIMYECVKRPIPFLLAGSIRDDGPLPDVVTDVLDAQRKMRELVQGVSFALMIATTLHSIAVGNLLPATTKVVCVDINPATVTKLADRGTFQTVGLVTDVEPFLRILRQELEE
ncbi:MAG: TIGR00300 family protein [Planctomyces sp.]|nr:TIGR00300 family protein [Planctomyces sp.]